MKIEGVRIVLFRDINDIGNLASAVVAWYVKDFVLIKEMCGCAAVEIERASASEHLHQRGELGQGHAARLLGASVHDDELIVSRIDISDTAARIARAELAECHASIVRAPIELLANDVRASPS